MKKLIGMICMAAGLLVAGCDFSTELPNGYIETTQEGSSTLVLKGYENTLSGFSVFQPEGFNSPLYIKEKKFFGMAYRFMECGRKGLNELPSMPESSDWQTEVSIVEGMSYWVRYTSEEMFNYVQLRVAYILGNEVGIEYLLAGSEKRPNTNANVAGDKVSVTAYEVPALDAANTYVDHYVTMEDGSKVLNLAIEWNAAKKHSQWVAFAFNNITAWDRNVGRTDKWAVDLGLPESMRIDNSYHTNDGFDRGHICASEDRQYSREANEQTFLYSNMSPQLNSLNGGFWLKLENQVREWTYSVSSNYFDNVYVVKGGTLNELAANLVGAGGVSTDAEGYTVKGLACPKYYFMALVAEREGSYQSIAFLVPHDGSLPSKAQPEDLKKYVLTIDQLETKAGIDFFCNLPDDVENAVESTCDVNLWSW